MPVKIGIDIGSSTTKIVAFEGEHMLPPMAVKADSQVASLYGAFGRYLYENKLELADVEGVYIPGVGSKYVEKAVYDRPTYKVDEFVATGTGGYYLTDKKEVIVISMGTGSFFVKVTEKEMKHLGGVGLGGGTICGLSSIMLNTGDIVDAGYKSAQWASFFDVAETYMADRLNILLPGNHENTGDLLYKQYGARTSLPNELEYGPLEGTGWCVVGDACFVFVNADPYSGQVGADVEADRARFFTEQTAWAKTVYEKADKTWRIMASHVGTYIVNFNDPSDYPYIPEMCDELQVDLYLNGHDHEYIRTTTKDNVICPIGSGTTYMTCSSLGEKLDAFEPGTAGGKYAVVHKDGADNSQQIFSMVTVDGNGIHATAYQRGVEEDWSKFDIIDHYDITTSLTKGSQAPTEVTEPAGPEITVLPTYTVQPGDCLYRIAKMLYGNGEKWNDLYEANRNIISDPACIYIGQVLRIPAK